MSDAKKCDVCAQYFDPAHRDGYQLNRDASNGKCFGRRYEWDLCSAACLVRCAQREIDTEAKQP